MQHTVKAHSTGEIQKCSFWKDFTGISVYYFISLEKLTSGNVKFA